MKTSIVYLGLGSNLGNREANIHLAIERLKPFIEIKKISRIIETDPVSGPKQGKYLNAVLKAETLFSPQKLLNLAKGIEKEFGRKKTIPNAPRPIDIDILLYDNQEIHSSELTIPHPRMFEREFVMTPLREIAPDVVQKFQSEIKI